MDILIVILGAVSVVLSIVCTVLVLSLKKGRDNDAIYEEFRRNRQEMAQANKETRTETTVALGKIEQKLNDMVKENYESRINLTEKIGESLKSIQQQNAESSDRQTKVIGESISKMQESNEKKLEQMRLTVDEKLNEKGYI